MTQPTFAQYRTLSTNANSIVPETLVERLLTVMSVLASVQNPDGTVYVP